MKLLTVQNYIDIKVENINIFRMIFFCRKLFAKNCCQKRKSSQEVGNQIKSFFGRGFTLAWTLEDGSRQLKHESIL
jgi:hypothetical protein